MPDHQSSARWLSFASYSIIEHIYIYISVIPLYSEGGILYAVVIINRSQL